MGERRLGPPAFPIRAARGWIAAAALLTAGGCAKRLPLVPAELERVQTEAGVQPLRVYPSKKLISLYAAKAVDEQFRVERDIRESERREQLKKIVTKNTPGLILKIEEFNGMPLLWVTFEPSCDDTPCAYGFVQTEDGKYRLITVPERDGYEAPRSFRGLVWKRRKLKPGKMKSLAEANEVMLVKKKNGKILTVDLTVKKVVDERTRTRTERSRGIE